MGSSHRLLNVKSKGTGRMGVLYMEVDMSEHCGPISTNQDGTTEGWRGK